MAAGRRGEAAKVLAIFEFVGEAMNATRSLPVWFAAFTMFFVATSAGRAQTVQLVDPQAVRAQGDALQAVVTVTIPASIEEQNCDIVIVGGGLGGSAAALAAAKRLSRVCLTEPTNWLGGQMTSQGISAFDDNKWIETTGATRSFQLLRQKIREHYAPLLRPGVKADHSLNPGVCWVSYECSEASVDHEVLEAMLAPYVRSGRLRIFLRYAPVAVHREGRQIENVTVYGFAAHRFVRLRGRVFIDATELGEFSLLAGAKFVTGAESQRETGEADAPSQANPSAAQSFTYAFVLEQRSSRDDSRKPTDYEAYAKHFSFRSTDADGTALNYGMYAQLLDTPGSFWTYRRLVAKEQFKEGSFASDLSMINWDSNDVCDQGLLSSDAAGEAKALQHGKRVSLAFAWWLQHDLPRDDGKGTGYPEVGIVSAALGSSDGLSQFPYVREARRLKALRTVHEQDLATADARALPFADSVGIGQYPMDIHACGAGLRLPASKPYQIPLGALISADLSNLLAASKNIGTTHITNGAYRVHPTEWAVGVAAGTVAAESVEQNVGPREIDVHRKRLRKLQHELIANGQPLVWFDDVPLDSPYFESAQSAALVGLISLPTNSLHFAAAEKISTREAGEAINRLLLLQGHPPVSLAPIEGQDSLDWSWLARFGHDAEKRKGVVTRGKFVDWLVSWYQTEQLSD